MIHVIDRIPDVRCVQEFTSGGRRIFMLECRRDGMDWMYIKIRADSLFQAEWIATRSLSLEIGLIQEII